MSTVMFFGIDFFPSGLDPVSYFVGGDSKFDQIFYPSHCITFEFIIF